MPRALEICVADVASARAAKWGGADRIELCAEVASGGLTPSAGMIAEVVERVGLVTHVLIRPRAGDFVHDRDEQSVMARDVTVARSMGVAGLVFGVLRADRTIDEDATARLIERARPRSVTFHKAIDLTPDPLAAIETLIRLGVDRVLTSGGPGPARGNIARLQAMVEHAEGRLIIMAGGGIVATDLPRLLDATGLNEIHLGSAVTGPAPGPTPFGAAPAPVEAARVRRVVELIRG